MAEMNKPMVGILAGAVLGFLDGLTALFTPEAAPMIQGILIGSTIKGMLAGIAAGFFARKYHNLWIGVAFGLVIGMLLSFAVAAMPSETGKHYYFEIMLPGSLVGALVGFATQRYGRRAPVAG
jgi:hypothetical protein